MTRNRPARSRSIFGRLMVAFGSVVVTVLLLSSLILNDFVESAFKRQLADMMMQDARGVALWAAPYLDLGAVPGDVRPHLPWLHAVTEGRLWLVNAKGEVLADTGATASSRFRGVALQHPWLTEVLQGQAVSRTDPDPWLRSAITVGHPVKRGDEVVGAVFLFSAPSRLRAEMGDFRLLLVATMIAAGLAGLGAAFTIARRLAKPVEEMSRFAQDLGQKRFAGPLPSTRIRELDQLSQALGGAAVGLQAAFDALSEEKQRIAALIQEMGEGVVAVGEDRLILVVNPAAGHLLGLPGPFDSIALTQAGFPDALAGALERRLQAREHDAEVVTFAVGGAEVSAWVSPVVAPDGRGFGAVALLRDVTTEVQLRRLRENFVANVSHELRGPLAALSAGVEALNDGLITPQGQPRFLKNMLAEIGRLRRLVDNLLELSRLDAGMLEIPLEEFDLMPLCEGLVEKWDHRAAAAGVALRMDCPHMRVVANIDRVEEIVANFLDNALRFTPAGGTVRLFARAEGDMVRVGVEDTGAGISREHLPHIWDRFYMVDPARTRSRGAGTGLGLSIVRQLVGHLGGEVQVESEPGLGSCFSFTLVAARPLGDAASSE